MGHLHIGQPLNRLYLVIDQIQSGKAGEVDMSDLLHQAFPLVTPYIISQVQKKSLLTSHYLILLTRGSTALHFPFSASYPPYPAIFHPSSMPFPPLSLYLSITSIYFSYIQLLVNSDHRIYTDTSSITFFSLCYSLSER